MATRNPSSRTALRTFVVLSLAAMVVAYSLPDIRRVWQPSGDFGYYTAFPDKIVTDLDQLSPADRAGLKVGDEIDIASTNRDYQFLVAGSPGTNLPGQRVVVPIMRGATERYVTMVSRPETMDTAAQVLIVGRELAMLLFVGVGAALVLLRPSITTWAFYAYCLGLNPAPRPGLLFYMLSPSSSLLGVIVHGFIAYAGWMGVALFAVLFLHEESRGWRRWACRLLPYALLIFWGLGTYLRLACYRFGWPEERVLTLALSLESLFILVALYAFVETYVLSRGADRQRIKWVIAGFAVALVAQTISNGNLPDWVYNSWPDWVYGSLKLAMVVVPLTVAYAVVRHRIIDVSFVANRALVYGVLTTLLVGVFALVDWLFIDKLKLARLGTIAEMGVAVAGGFWFNGLHRRVDSLIDATFFRQRHKAERQLARVAAALPLATTAGAVANCVVNEPVRAMLLASAALFRRDRDGVYAREQSEGWDASTLLRLDDSDETLLMLAQAEGGPLSLFDHPWRTEGVPSGPAHPVLALPIIVRRELAAIVFYGAHVHGEALDPDEIKAIASLAPGAAAAYDHLDAEAMQQQVASMQKTIEIQQALLAEAQIQPA